MLSVIFRTIFDAIKQAHQYNKTVKLMTKVLPKNNKLIAEKVVDRGDTVIITFRRFKSFDEIYQMNGRLKKS